jgi:MATE family multidrug resistance protein
MGLVDGTIMATTRNILPRAFSTDPEVIRMAARVMPVLAAFQLFDATTALVNGILRGLGRQKIGGYANLLVYYLIAVPLALFLCFGPAKLELAGLWTGCVVGSSLITVSEGLYIIFFKWERAVEDAAMRGD